MTILFTLVPYDGTYGVFRLGVQDVMNVHCVPVPSGTSGGFFTFVALRQMEVIFGIPDAPQNGGYFSLLWRSANWGVLMAPMAPPHPMAPMARVFAQHLSPKNR